MGPLATVDLFEKIVRNPTAAVDQDHPKIIVYNNPQIPSRVDALLHGGESPRQALVASALLLEKAGADLIVMPCNTAHYWYEDIRRAISVGFIHMIENAADYMAAAAPGEKAMLFATAATVDAGLYQRAFAARDMALAVPGPDEQKLISRAIDAVKAGKVEDNPCLAAIDGIIADYRKTGINAFVAGCTEIPLLFPLLAGDFRRIDPPLLLAREAVRRATAGP
jgi:aspartate racemase